MNRIATVCCSLVIIIAGLFIGTTGVGPTDALAVQSTACTATIDSNYSLHIPVLASKNVFIKADFVYEYNPVFPSLIPFRLTNAAVLQNWAET